MKAVGYLRVSTDQQVSEGLGLEVQAEALAAYCEREGITLVETYRDEGISGAETISGRPALAAALVAVEDGDAEALIVYRLDRLARTLILQETIIERVKARGGRVISTAEADVDADDPTRVMVRQILGVIAQYERALISQRLQAGRAAKASRGGYAYGAPPYGYRAEDGTLVPVEDEQKVIARILGLRAEGLALRAISERLNVEGVEAPRAGRWNHDTVGQILRRERDKVQG